MNQLLCHSKISSWILNNNKNAFDMGLSLKTLRFQKILTLFQEHSEGLKEVMPAGQYGFLCGLVCRSGGNIDTALKAGDYSDIEAENIKSLINEGYGYRYRNL